MKKKIIKVGNSYAIIIPSHIIKARKLKSGSEIELIEAVPEKQMTIFFDKKDPAILEQKQFYRWVHEFMEQHGDALAELAKR